MFFLYFFVDRQYDWNSAKTQPVGLAALLFTYRLGMVGCANGGSPWNTARYILFFILLLLPLLLLSFPLYLSLPQ